MAAEVRRFAKTFLTPCYYQHHQILLRLVQKGIAQEFIPCYIVLWVAEFLLRIMIFPPLLPMKVGSGRKLERKATPSCWMPWFWSVAEGPRLLCVLMWRRSGSAPQSHMSSADDNFLVPVRPRRHFLRSLNTLLPVTVVGIILHEKQNRPVHKWKVGPLEHNISPRSALGINTPFSFFVIFHSEKMGVFLHTPPIPPPMWDLTGKKCLVL